LERDRHPGSRNPSVFKQALPSGVWRTQRRAGIVRRGLAPAGQRRPRPPASPRARRAEPRAPGSGGAGAEQWGSKRGARRARTRRRREEAALPQYGLEYHRRHVLWVDLLLEHPLQGLGFCLGWFWGSRVQDSPFGAQEVRLWRDGRTDEGGEGMRGTEAVGRARAPHPQPPEARAMQCFGPIGPPSRRAASCSRRAPPGGTARSRALSGS
jgi:hypothetical protein